MAAARRGWAHIGVIRALQTAAGFLDFSLSGGLIKGEKLIAFLRSHFVDRDIGELPPIWRRRDRSAARP